MSVGKSGVIHRDIVDATSRVTAMAGAMAFAACRGHHPIAVSRHGLANKTWSFLAADPFITKLVDAHSGQILDVAVSEPGINAETPASPDVALMIVSPTEDMARIRPRFLKLHPATSEIWSPNGDLTNPDPTRQVAAMRVASKLNQKDVIPTLRQVAFDQFQSPRVRFEALATLAVLEPVAWTPVLASLLEEKSPRFLGELSKFGYEVPFALADVGTQQAADYLEKIADSELPSEYRASAVWAMGEMFAPDRAERYVSDHDQNVAAHARVVVGISPISDPGLEFQTLSFPGASVGVDGLDVEKLRGIPELSNAEYFAGLRKASRFVWQDADLVRTSRRQARNAMATLVAVKTGKSIDYSALREVDVLGPEVNVVANERFSPALDQQLGLDHWDQTLEMLAAEVSVERVELDTFERSIFRAKAT